MMELKSWLDEQRYFLTDSVPAWTSRRVHPLADLWWRRPLGVHSRPSRFWQALPAECRRLHRLFYQHLREPEVRSWPGLVEEGQALWQLTAVAGRYILSSIQGRSPGEFVYLGDDSGLLLQASQRWIAGEGGGRALDLCGGCGVVGLGLPAGFREVVGLDANPTAVELANANAELNAVRRYRALVSDMWSAAEGEFDYVVGNPPALPLRGEGRKLLYAYGGEDPASLTLRAVEGLDEHLAPGGQCLLLSWSVREQLWSTLQRMLTSEFSLSYQPRRFWPLSDPELGWMEHVWIRIVRDSRGRRERLPMSWRDRMESWSWPWAAPEPPAQARYAGSQRTPE